jgi:citrate synthase
MTSVMTTTPHVGVAASSPPPAPKGLKGLVVGTTAVGDVRGEQGFFHYRQYDATELARTRSFSDVAALVLDGALPADADTSRAFAREFAQARILPESVLAALPAVAAVPGGPVPLAPLRTALSLAAAGVGERPLLDLDPAERRAALVRLCAATPVLAVALHRLAAGLAPVAPRADLGAAADQLWMLTGEEPNPIAVRALEAYLVSTIDHGFNASTFTARVVTSTGADAGSVLVAALGALSGPLHGGAPSRALALLDEITPATGERRTAAPDVRTIDAVVRPRIERGERIMGFGHAVYRTEDPRSRLLSDMADELAEGSAAAAARVAAAHAVERRVVELLEEHRPGRALRTNVEFYAAVVLELCGVPPELFSATFASSRVVGWSAHALEQAAERQIIRPSARYTGPTPPEPVPAPPS